MTSPYIYQASGRDRRTILVVTVFWIGLAFLYFALHAAGWIVAILGFFSLPAVWDIISDRPSGLELSDTRIKWYSGAREHETELANIKSVRFDTRLDFSVRVSLVLRNDRKVRLPYDCLPPHRELEGRIKARGIKTERHHFTLLS